MSKHQHLVSLFSQRQARHSLPGALYHDPAVFNADMDEIFHKDWIFVGHTFEVPASGSYLSAQIGKYPVVIVRDGKGELRALHNVCRHRGSRVCSQSKGKVAKLVCPYHQWTFDLDGRLLFARDMPGNFDAKSYALHTAHVRTLETYIFVSVAEQPTDFEKFADRLRPFLLLHRLADAKVAFESEIIENGNWKLVFENNRECYHCDANHPELLRSFQESPSVAGLGQVDPEVAAHWNACEAVGLPSQLVIDEGGQFRITRIPLNNGAESYTMNGRAAVKKRMVETDGTNIGALLFFHYPNTWNHFMGDHALSFRVEPISATQTRVITKWLVHKNAEEGRDYDRENLTKVWLATNDQDRRLVEETQVGVNSPAYQPGMYSSITENGVCQFVDWYCAAMADRLGGGA